MARPATFTDEEDDIILLGLSYEETIRRLVEAGFGERTTQNVKARRSYIRRQRMISDDPVLALRHRKAQLQLRQEELSDQLRQVTEELSKVDDQFHYLINEELAKGDANQLDPRVSGQPKS